MIKALFPFTAVLISMAGAARAQPQTLLLNTGYDHANNALYALGAQDQYWTKIASYEPPTTTTPVAAAWVYADGSNWRPSLSLTTTPTVGSRWIGPRVSRNSSAGTSLSNPAFSMYRKCFSMAQGFQNGQINIRIVADDIVHVWLNDVNRTLVPQSLGRFQGGTPLINSNTNPGLKAGRNCIYVLVQDIAGYTGFDLAGTVSATSGAITPLLAANNGPPSTVRHDGSGVVGAIVAFAEARRATAPTRRPSGGTPAGRSAASAAAQ